MSLPWSLCFEGVLTLYLMFLQMCLIVETHFSLCLQDLLEFQQSLDRFFHCKDQIEVKTY